MFQTFQRSRHAIGAAAATVIAAAAFTAAAPAPASAQTQPPPVPPEVLTEACVEMQLDIKAVIIRIIQESCQTVVDIALRMHEAQANPSLIDEVITTGKNRISAFEEAGLDINLRCFRDCLTLLDSYDEPPDAIVPLKNKVAAARQSAIDMVRTTLLDALLKIDQVRDEILPQPQ